MIIYIKQMKNLKNERNKGLYPYFVTLIYLFK